MSASSRLPSPTVYTRSRHALLALAVLLALGWLFYAAVWPALQGRPDATSEPAAS